MYDRGYLHECISKEGTKLNVEVEKRHPMGLLRCQLVYKINCIELILCHPLFSEYLLEI